MLVNCDYDESDEDGDITPKAANHLVSSNQSTVSGSRDLLLSNQLDSVSELDEDKELREISDKCWSTFSWSSLYDRGTESSLSWADDVRRYQLEIPTYYRQHSL